MNSRDTRKPKRAAASHKAAKRSAARLASGVLADDLDERRADLGRSLEGRQEPGDVGIGSEREDLDVEHPDTRSFARAIDFANALRIPDHAIVDREVARRDDAQSCGIEAALRQPLRGDRPAPRRRR
jgi:hypothetical protein